MPLEIHIQALDIANLEARMQAMARPAYTAVTLHARAGEPALLFVPTRKHARLAALDLLTFAAADGQPKRFLQARGPPLPSLLFCFHGICKILDILKRLAMPGRAAACVACSDRPQAKELLKFA